MSKVLFFNIPAYGHTNPTLPLTAGLVRRGASFRQFWGPELAVDEIEAFKRKHGI